MKDWQLWEVFMRGQNGLAHKHIGSVHAVDAPMAIQNARDVHGRREEAVSIWVVRASDIVASQPADRTALFEAAAGRSFRHAAHYTVPEGIEHL